jgi:hypothetical protein
MSERTTQDFADKGIPEDEKIRDAIAFEKERALRCVNEALLATCRGSLALGTGCGKCSRCLQERNETETVRIADENYQAGLKHGKENVEMEIKKALDFEHAYWIGYGGAKEAGAARNGGPGVPKNLSVAQSAIHLTGTESAGR